MPAPDPDYFRYFSRNPEAAAWGLALTAAGFTRILPDTDYPPVRHPADHHFDWASGRTLSALQIVLITAGRGTLEIRGKRCAVRAGQAFILLPGVWHRYRPDAASGWEESWMEVKGPLVTSMVRAGVFSKTEVLRDGGLGQGLDTALAEVHATARRTEESFSPDLAAAAYRVLAAWAGLGRASATPSRLHSAVQAAERFLGEHLTEPVNVAALARRLGVAYSHFRRAFKLHTGYAPWQYVLHLRLAHARRALASSDATLEAIAARFGFSSAFHFSAAFKKAQGTAPDTWRRQIRSDGE
jgi:AraC-like DNA-binding protein